ncbi:tetratricopeptide repeat protein [Candidatus Fermentibacteria bacterium]|nr:tetratricopeptide repeat protein [Candidatus Fermentibacteria bacterium]
MKPTPPSRFPTAALLCRVAPASLAVLALVLGCASSGIGRARSLVRDNRLTEALLLLEELAREDPSNGEALDLLGQAYYRSGRFGEAEVRLAHAQSRGFWSAEGVLYRGLMRERSGDIDGAVRVYQSYAAVPSRQAQRKIRGRIQLILRQRIQDEMAQLVREESSRGISGDRMTVGVFPLRYIGVSSELKVLGRGLAEFIITDLSKVKTLQVLERSRIAALMEEIGLGASGVVDDRFALRMGRITGAGTVLNGIYRDHAAGVKIETALADVAKGRLDNLRPAGGTLDQVFDLEKTIVFEAISRLGVELTEIEREDIARMPTRSLLAFMSFCRGLGAEDVGDWPAAHTHYQAAAKADPGFKEAADKAQQLAETDRVAEGVDHFERDFLGWQFGPDEGAGESPGVVEGEAAGSGDEEEASEAMVDPAAETPEDQVWEAPEDRASEASEDLASEALEDLADVATGPIDPGEGSREPSVGGSSGPPTIVIDIDFP